jgi:hypothetical protein
MGKHWLSSLRKEMIASCAALAVATGTTGMVHAQNAAAPTDTTSLQMQLEAQQRQIDELKRLIQVTTPQPQAAPAAQPANGGLTSEVNLLQPNSSVGDPFAAPGPINADQPITSSGGGGKDQDAKFKVGYDLSKGMYFNAALAPDFPMTQDGKFPFELRIRGRIQADYYGYKVTDTRNHLTNVDVQFNDQPDESVFEVKRMRLIFAGYMFTPDLRYQIQFDGNNRGLNTETTSATNSAFNNVVVRNSGAATTGGSAGVTLNGGNISAVDAGVRLLEAWVAYDFHGEPGAYGYRSTFSPFVGKIKPMGSFEEYLGSANAQFVEFGMSSWMFDSDADNYLTGAGFQYHAIEDRLYIFGMVTTGSDNQVPVYNDQDIPGINIGGWYDFGGTWDEKTCRWKLYGETISDIEQHEDPILRVGGAANLTPMGRRSQYSTAELDFYKAATAAPGGTNVDSIFNGGGLGTGGNFAGVANGTSPYQVDAFDAYTFSAFYAFKYCGFSLYNEFWCRDYDNFRGLKNPPVQNSSNGSLGSNPILYTTNAGGTSGAALFNKGYLVDLGMACQAGYFLIPHKLEVAVRYDLIDGTSGDINGNGTYKTVSAASLGIKTSTAATLPANTIAPANIRIVNGAFDNYHPSQEIALGVNYFFVGEKVKWQTDINFYTGGNPAVNGQSPAGYIPGVNGYMLRSQIQFSF